MSFTDQQQRIATEKECKAPWGGGKPGERFRCCLCGHRFQVGDKWRWVYTNHIPGAGGNPLVCDACDGPDVIDKWKVALNEGLTRFWWMSPVEE